jgi:hypothetical protein
VRGEELGVVRTGSPPNIGETVASPARTPEQPCPQGRRDVHVRACLSFVHRCTRTLADRAQSLLRWGSSRNDADARGDARAEVDLGRSELGSKLDRQKSLRAACTPRTCSRSRQALQVRACEGLVREDTGRISRRGTGVSRDDVRRRAVYTARDVATGSGPPFREGARVL